MITDVIEIWLTLLLGTVASPALRSIESSSGLEKILFSTNFTYTQACHVFYTFYLCNATMCSDNIPVFIGSFDIPWVGTYRIKSVIWIWFRFHTDPHCGREVLLDPDPWVKNRRKFAKKCQNRNNYIKIYRFIF